MSHDWELHFNVKTYHSYKYVWKLYRCSCCGLEHHYKMRRILCFQYGRHEESYVKESPDGVKIWEGYERPTCSEVRMMEALE